MQPYLLWQLVDSALPAGGFAHSGGLEAAARLGMLRGERALDRYLARQLEQVGSGALPFVSSTHEAPSRLATLDRLFDVSTTNHVANRASRALGRAWIAAATAAFDLPSLRELKATLRDGAFAGHLAPAFGAVTRALELPRADAQRMFLFIHARSVVSSAVRLDVIGPLEGQAALARAAPHLEAVWTRCRSIPAEEAAQASPLLDIWQAPQSPLFASLLELTRTTMHDHGHDPGHKHEPMDGPGDYHARERPRRTDYRERAFTVGVGGPVGSGKTALVLELCRRLRDRVNLAVVTNDIFTREDAEFLVRHGALAADRIRAVETGGCPHAAIREDIAPNLLALEELHAKWATELLLIESGGDNLAANFSRELADYIVYVIDVAGGDKVPRKGGPGITEADLLVINKTDLAPAVGADLDVMARDARRMRGEGPVVFSQVTKGVGVDAIADHVIHAWQHAAGAKH